MVLDLGSSTIFKDGGGIICGQSGSLHLNYGRRCKDDLNEFQQKVQDIMDGKPYDKNEEFKNIDYTEASKMVGISEEDFKNQCIIY